MATLRRTAFGDVNGQAVDRYELSTDEVTVGLLTYGATIQSLLVPDAQGNVADVALGFDGAAGYAGDHPYFGAVIGRFANRIAGGRFELDGHTYQLPLNRGATCLHGGTTGFDRYIWDARPIEDGDTVAVEFEMHSPDGDMGFPGALCVNVVYTLRGGHLTIDYGAQTDRATVINLTNHVYFNLAGAGSGTIEGHRLEINGSRYTPVDVDVVPTGELAAVEGTPLDFRQLKSIGIDLRTAHEQLVRAQGYDHNWVLDRSPANEATFAARVHEPVSGRVLEVWTDQPGVQFYSGNFLDGSLAGKGGSTYRQGDGFCLETQHFPDSPNHPQFPSTRLAPGERYATRTTFGFGVIT